MLATFTEGLELFDFGSPHYIPLFRSMIQCFLVIRLYLRLFFKVKEYVDTNSLEATDSKVFKGIPRDYSSANPSGTYS